MAAVDDYGFLSEKFALKSSQPSKNSDFYMGDCTLEHVMETLDNESFHRKSPASKCVQAFNSIQRGEQHHGRLERASPCQDNSGESQPSVPSTHGDGGQAPPAPVQQAVLVFPVCSFPALARFVFTFQHLHTREYCVDRQMINQLSSMYVHLQFVANRCSGNYSLDVTPLFVSANLD